MEPRLSRVSRNPRRELGRRQIFLFFCSQPFEKSRFGKMKKGNQSNFAFILLVLLTISSPSGCIWGSLGKPFLRMAFGLAGTVAQRVGAGGEGAASDEFPLQVHPRAVLDRRHA